MRLSKTQYYKRTRFGVVVCYYKHVTDKEYVIAVWLGADTSELGIKRLKVPTFRNAGVGETVPTTENQFQIHYNKIMKKLT